MNKQTLKRINDNYLRTQNNYKTYIILDAFGVFKVGRSKDVDSRIRQIATANPYIIKHKIIDLDCENELHKILDKFNREWFSFIQDYNDIPNPVLGIINYTYMNILILVSLIKNHGIEKAKYIYSEIMFNRFKHIYTCN